MQLQRFAVGLMLCTCLVACAAQQPSVDAGNKPYEERQRDAVECQALASQAAAGSGDWSSDRAIRNAWFRQTRDAYLGLVQDTCNFRP